MMRKTSLVLLSVAAGAAATLFLTQPRSALVGSTARAASSDTYRQLNLFGDVFERVRSDYVEKPDDSTAFQKFPKILKNHHATAIICDYLRMVGMNADDPNQIEDVMARELKKTLHEELHGAHALQTVADSLPALGIVAAVLGVIKTMAHIDQPPAVLGQMIGGALVGTFLGVFLAYGFVAPLAQRLGEVMKQDLSFYDVIKSVLVAGLHRHATNLCVEVGRQAAPDHVRPSFVDVENALRDIKKAS